MQDFEQKLDILEKDVVILKLDVVDNKQCPIVQKELKVIKS